MSKFNFKSDSIVYCALKAIKSRYEDEEVGLYDPLSSFNINELCLDFSDMLEEKGITRYNFNSFLDNGWSARWKEYQESLVILKADELEMMTFIYFSFMEMFLKYTQQRFVYPEYLFLEADDVYSDKDVLNVEALNSAIWKFEK